MRPILPLIAIGLVLLSYELADARMPPGGPSPEAGWFAKLKSPRSGASCCDLSDCFRLDPGHSRINPDGTVSFLAVREEMRGMGDNHWHVIPEDTWIRGKELAKIGGNPTGSLVICAEMIGEEYYVMCAIPPAGT